MPTTDELAAEIDQLRTQVPTLEDLVIPVSIPSWTESGQVTRWLNGGVAMTLLVAPIPMRILSCALSWEYWSQAADDNVYWEARLDTGNGAAGFGDIATRTTQLTGPYANGPIDDRVAWTFDAAAWAPADLSTHDMVRLVLNPRGGAGGMKLPLTATLRYAAQ